MLDTSKMCFVFGSNLAGVHGAGAAKVAREKHGAQLGIGVGPTGTSYAIPTKDHNIRTMPIERIEPYVTMFLAYAKAANPSIEFQVTRIGCGLAGFTDNDIAPLFKGATQNVLFDSAWEPWFGTKNRYWGHVA